MYISNEAALDDGVGTADLKMSVFPLIDFG